MFDSTLLVHAGRDPEAFQGVVNTPVFRASTVLASSIAEWEQRKKERAAEQPGTYYGRHGTPTTHSFEEAMAALEGGHRTLVFPSGLAACAFAILPFVGTGDHVLITDSAYDPTRRLAAGVLKRFGVTTEFYDPLAAEGIEALIKPNTRLIYTESPGSHTFEMQDTARIAEVAHRHGALVAMDNTWATPLYFKPLQHGVDISVQAATKYIVGHSDAMLGTVTVNRALWPQLKSTAYDLGQISSPDDCYLALRGLRTLAVRLKQHWLSGVALAQWLARQPEVECVLHPALPGDPGHEIWQRDFKGASGLFSVVMKPMAADAFAALIDGLELFGIGASWGGYESLVLPIDPAGHRSVTTWPHRGPAFRVHAGLEDMRDLIADLEQGFARLRKLL
ncbi:MAG: cystathionine beta-lyase [Burkholderiales bacterium]|nr:cystathionine beta-lyase [Burkholderiales bacterium]